jgi:hypothetical protein
MKRHWVWTEASSTFTSTKKIKQKSENFSARHKTLVRCEYELNFSINFNDLSQCEDILIAIGHRRKHNLSI